MTTFSSQSLRRWRDEPVAFVEEVLIDPATNQAFVLLPAERHFFAQAFRTGANGRLLYPELIYACPKKSGKTTFAGIFTITIIVLYGGKFGEAVLCANDYEQSVGRVFQMVRRIIEASPLLCADAKITQDKIIIAGAVISAIASDAASSAGADPVVSVFDELWGYTSERAHRLWDEQIPPPTRKIAARLTVTYAGFENESTLLLGLYKRGLAQPLIGPDLRGGDGVLMFWAHAPVAPWQDEAWLSEMRRSLRPNQYLRMIENRFVTSETTFISMAAWDRCVDPRLGAVVVDHLLPVWIGIDASIVHDSTALACVCFDQTTQQVRLVNHKIFQPSPDQPLDFEEKIEGTIFDWQRRYDIKQILFDPWQMQSTSQRLLRAGLPIEKFDQTVPNLTSASQNLYELIQGQNLHCYADDAMRLAISRAVAIEGSRGWRIDKSKQSHRIDIVIALGMACHACVQAQSKHPELDYSGWCDEGDKADPDGVRAFQTARYLNYVNSFAPNYGSRWR